ncbi:MAG: carboxypeptidase regulatory-like domain-containing protein, partial [Gemmatimonadetes bacterium]|nr:carboxypeptidase regulatory-like domain-containing protein [Gemmatimonadota bacterium]
MLRKILLITLVLLFTTANGWSQEMRGHLEGRVLDAQGIPLEEVNITVSGPSLQGMRGAVTDDCGYFRIPSLSVGVYEVEVSHVAYRAVEYQEVAIHLGKTNLLGEIRLKDKTVDVAEIVVSGGRPL